MDKFAIIVAFLVLLHIWQSALALMALFLLDNLLRKSSTEIRYWLAVAIFYFVVLAPFIFFVPGKTIYGTAKAILVQSRLELHIYDLTWLGIFIGVIWLGGSIAHLYKLIRSILNSNALRLSAISIASVKPPLEVEARMIPVVVSDKAGSPMVIGFSKPLIILPTYFLKLASDAEIRAVLLHEEFHVQRRDMIFSLVEQVIIALLWWNPIMERILSKIRVLREVVCDRYAADRGDDPIAYAKILTRTAQYVQNANKYEKEPLALYSAHFGIHYRVRSLIQTDNQTPSSTTSRLIRKVAVSVGLIIAFVIIILTTPRASAGNKSLPYTLTPLQNGVHIEAWRIT